MDRRAGRHARRALRRTPTPLGRVALSLRERFAASLQAARRRPHAPPLTPVLHGDAFVFCFRNRPAMFQSRIVPLSPAAATIRPFGAKQTDHTKSVSWLIFPSSRPVLASTN